MLKSVTLQNYKCFSKETQIELTPLTILTGVNSSGKTTILNNLNFQCQGVGSSHMSHYFRISPKQSEALELSKLYNISLDNIDYIDIEVHYTQDDRFVNIKPFPSKNAEHYTYYLTGELNDDPEELRLLFGTSDVVANLYSKVKHIEADRECTKMPNISNSMKKWMKHMKLGNLDSAGTRYVLPILMAGTQLQQGQTLIVENPEIFLHPKNQLKLADFFISLVNTGRQVIIETHSDHIINRVLRRVLECKTTSLLNSTTIYFLQKQSIEHISIDRCLGITKAPDDFFGQFADETGKIVSAGLGNMKRGN